MNPGGLNNSGIAATALRPAEVRRLVEPDLVRSVIEMSREIERLEALRAVAVAEIDRDGWNQVDCADMRAIDPAELLRRFGAKLEADPRGHLKVQQPFD